MFRPYEADSRVIVLDDVSQFADVRGFTGGVLCPYDPFSKDDEKAIKQALRAKMTWSKISTYIDEPEQDGLPPSVREAFNTISCVKQNLIDVHHKMMIVANFIVDGGRMHEHNGVSINYPLSGKKGMEVETADGRGVWHTPLRHIFAFDHTIRHRSYPGISRFNPKISILSL
ncbi:MAG: hypothetical protein DI551_02470 [Micavibrio aeruginosavorus]|uniref:Uncharacterized protein n=1 Tax=Micavibrio aeruginosavorus TaxID=349221 RepID=A0A2W5PSY9_9BACT|nr:MAG: hypothetical protein DI551_02470 [Micavibrio aeruginosavorus]